MNETAADIYRAATLSQVEIDLVESYIEDDNDGCFMDTSAYEKLSDFFVDEMPIGVAKGRTGEPDVWILDYLRAMPECLWYNGFTKQGS